MTKIYPDASTLSYDSCEFALGLVQKQLDNQTWQYCTFEQLLVAERELLARMDYLWENGGKQQFQEMLNRTFGDRAITV